MARIENTNMQNFLAANGIKAKAKYIWHGSMKHVWRISDWRNQKWTPELCDKFNALGFLSHDGQPLQRFSGNGGAFQVFVRGHYELIPEGTIPPTD